jgi:hypothetical protein
VADREAEAARLALPVLTLLRPALLALLAVGLSFASGERARSGEIDLMAPIAGLALREPPDPPRPGERPFYSETAPNPNWNVAQWNIPREKLSSFARRGGRFEASAPAARILATLDGAAELALAQDGSVLPCTVADGAPREFDLFLGPNGPDLAGAGAVGWLANGAKAPALSELNRLTLHATASYGGSLAPTNKGCGVNQGGVLLALILSNPEASPPQTLFYQLHLGRVCGTGDPAHDASCRAPPQRQVYFFAQNPFGVDDYLPLAGEPWLDRDEERAVRTDVLPRLMTALAEAPPGMERDPARWRVTGFYAGQNIWGDIRLSTRWSGLRVVAETR